MNIYKSQLVTAVDTMGPHLEIQRLEPDLQARKQLQAINHARFNIKKENRDS